MTSAADYIRNALEQIGGEESESVRRRFKLLENSDVYFYEFTNFRKDRFELVGAHPYQPRRHNN